MQTPHPSRRRRVAAVAALLAAFSLSAAYAQSLGEVAQRQAERRSEAKPGRVYTNADLDAPYAEAGKEPAPAAPEEPKKIVSKQLNGTTVEEDPKTGTANIVGPPARNKRDEQYWRTRAKNVRTRFARASADMTAIQTRLKALDMEAPSSANAQERAVLLKALSNQQIELRSASDDVAKMETAAEFAKIPKEWTQ